VSETRVKKNHGRQRSNSVEHNYGAIERILQKIMQYLHQHLASMTL